MSLNPSRMALREVMGAIRAESQGGFSPGVATDAQLGLSVVVHESAAILFGSREGGSRTPVRIEGTCARARGGG